MAKNKKQNDDQNDDSKKGLANADEETRYDVAEAGGEAMAEMHEDDDFYEQIGAKGGEAAQDSDNGHELTDEERSRGGSNSGGNFKKNRQRASEAGRK